jgi:excisionase family DNA binding protein
MTHAVPESENLLTIDELAAVLHVRRQRAYDVVRQGLVPAVRVGRQLRVDRLALRAWIHAGGQALAGGWRHRPQNAGAARPGSPGPAPTGYESHS